MKTLHGDNLKRCGLACAGALVFAGLFSPAVHAEPATPRYEIKAVNGRPLVLEDGKPLAMAAYVNSIIWNRDDWKKRVDTFIASGVKTFYITPWHHDRVYGQSPFWTDENVYPSPPTSTDADVTLDFQAEYVLSKVPDARFMVRPCTYAPKAWREKNPGEISSTRDELTGEVKTYEESWASQKYLDGLRANFHNMVRYIDSRPWGKRVVGYMILPLGEGITGLACGGHFYDQSPAMQRAWSAYLKKKYGNDEALRAAWGDNEVSLANIAVPDDASLRRKINTLPHWPALVSMQRERDYSSLQREIFAKFIDTLVSSVKEAAAHPVVVGVDAMKQPQLGWQLRESFEGTGQYTQTFSMYAASGSIDVGSILDNPSLDYTWTPADYTARGMGMPLESEGLGDSLVLRGKAHIIEDDARTWLAQETADFTPPTGSFMTEAEVKAGLERNVASALSRGFWQYWTDIGFRSSYFTDPAIQKQIEHNTNIIKRARDLPHRETEHAIAVIIDDESPLYENFTTGFQQIALFRQRLEGLGLSGLPHRMYLLSDLKRADFPKYRCYLFPNLFKVDDATIDLLRRKVLRDGSLAIFGPGTGITDGKEISAAGAQKLLGMPMKLHPQSASRRVRIARGSHPSVTDPQMPALYGDSYAYGPTLTPDAKLLREQKDPSVHLLGDSIIAFPVLAPGLVLKDFGKGAAGNGVAGERGADDYAVVFTAAVPLPAPLLRSLARYGGCHVWVDRDSVVTASDSVASLHVNESGTYRLRFPRRAKRVVDAATGKVVATDVTELRLKMTAPETKTFFWE